MGCDIFIRHLFSKAADLRFSTKRTDSRVSKRLFNFDLVVATGLVHSIAGQEDMFSETEPRSYKA